MNNETLEFSLNRDDWVIYDEEGIVCVAPTPGSKFYIDDVKRLTINYYEKLKSMSFELGHMEGPDRAAEKAHQNITWKRQLEGISFEDIQRFFQIDTITHTLLLQYYMGLTRREKLFLGI